MSYLEIIQIFIYLVLLVAVTPILGKFIYKVFNYEPTLISKLFSGFENLIYRFSGIKQFENMNWKEYTTALLVFNGFGFLTVLLLQLFQQSLPLNTENLPDVPFWLSFNTAVSFMSNTNWQAYSGESTLSYLVQMLGLTVQNFLSAATGIAVVVALTRGLMNQSGKEIGNFYSDVVKSTLYILLPLSVILAVVLIGQGVVQSFSPYLIATTLEGPKQIIPLGPAASQIAIKQLGTNGGGFFGVNSAHPFENPTPFSNFLQMFSILMIPASLTYTYGLMVKNLKQGWVIFSVMFLLFVTGLAVSLYSEYQAHPETQVSKSLEGKEVRFGTANSVLWEVATTDASNGSVNAMHDSFSPLSGMIGIINMMLGEIIFGGVGAGLYGILIFVILTVFIAGLMVGRTPEYLGKKVEAFEVKMAMIAVLSPNFVILVFTAIAVVSENGLSSLTNHGPHGFSEILYAFSSAAGNNGSAFGGLNANTDFYNIMIAIGMLIGRFGVILPVLAIAGSMSVKKITPNSAGTFQTNNSTFVVLLISVILIVGALTFFPALSLGPIIEHFLMSAGKGF